ncbi:hypothetical protein ERO13_D11G253675v2 [Gossypium hirsutum]|uniref:Uncharacterized protein n=1 Tax=Gossypium barbadense TaxID=3634 RepID=A0A5J5PJY6_GOSBA|nr:hypothetical protein ES319_D11G276500v1 [Gossypium barbadense]KAG4122235.1 hypothetical protein ERO13_D11G253675v2 [Gossypium hirsutum]
MFQIATLEPMITGLQEALPKSIGLLPFDRGVTGCMRLVKVQLSWGRKSELEVEVLRGINETGSVLYWMGLLHIVLRELDTTHFMQTAPWLGLLPGADGQIFQKMVERVLLSTSSNLLQLHLCQTLGAQIQPLFTQCQSRQKLRVVPTV